MCTCRCRLYVVVIGCGSDTLKTAGQQMLIREAHRLNSHLGDQLFRYLFVARQIRSNVLIASDVCRTIDVQNKRTCHEGAEITIHGVNHDYYQYYFSF